MKTEKRYVYRVMSDLSIADTGDRFNTRKEAQAEAEKIKARYASMGANQCLRVERVARKTFYIQNNIGHAKYVVNFHDGAKTHPDGSPFFDIEIFKNKKSLAAFVSGLCSIGYSERHNQ